MGLLGKAITAGAGHRKTLDTISDELFPGVGDVRAKQWKFWMLLVLSSIIAAGGVIGNATPAVIGAMIVAPLATPIYGVALATVSGSRKNLGASVLLLIEGIVVNILIGVAIGLITFDRMPLAVNPQVTGRTAPTLLDLTVAVFTGIAGSFALVRRDVSNILAGVAIAISLVPVLAVVGITLGSGAWGMALGAFILFLTNAAAIIVAGVVVFTAAGYQRDAAARGAHIGRRAKWVIAVLVIILVVGLSAASLRIYAYQVYVNDTETAVQAWAEGSQWTVETVDLVGTGIVATAVGPEDPPSLEELKQAVRARVPGSVPVTIVLGNGRNVHL